MAQQMMFVTSNSMNYREPDDQDIGSDVQKLVSGELKLDNYRPIQELERIKSESDQALEMNPLSTPQQNTMAESLQHNTGAWIDTAKDVLNISINIASLGKIFITAAETSVLKTEDEARAMQYKVSIGEGLQSIYNRACDMAVYNSIRTALQRHRNDLTRFQQHEVNVNVPYQSHAELRHSIERAETNQQSDVRQKARQSSRAWDTAKYLGVIVLAVGAIISMALLKPKP